MPRSLATSVAETAASIQETGASIQNVTAIAQEIATGLAAGDDVDQPGGGIGRGR